MNRSLMMITKTGTLSIIWLGCIISLPTSMFGYQWPVPDFNIQHPTTATLGEYREPDRFHQGIDISRDSGLSVYPVESGEVIQVEPAGPNRNVVVRDIYGRNYSYVHIIPSVKLYENVVVGVTELGTILHNHVHLRERDGTGDFNPLRDDGINPAATQSDPPAVFMPEFRRDGTAGNSAAYYTNRIDGRINMYGKVNIITRAREGFDAQNGGLQNCGMYRMDYRIVREATGASFGPYESFRFDALYNVNPVPNVYAQDPGRMSLGPYDIGPDEICIYYYVNTFQCAGNFRYLNTKKRAYCNPDIEARINDEATFPDGNYTVWVRGWNIRGVGGDEANRRGAEDEIVILDNFTPYVQELSVEAEGTTKYKGQWPTLPSSNTVLGELNKAPNDTVPRSKELTIKLVFSEDMNITVNPSLVIILPGGSQKPLGAGYWTDSRHYQVNVPDSLVPVDKNGYCTVQISGAKDLVGNLLDVNPKTIASRNALNIWTHYEQGADINHKFKIGIIDAPQVESTDPIKDKTGIEINKQIKITFSETIDTTTFSASTVTFEPALNGSFTTSWNSSQTEATLSLTDSLNDFKYGQKYTITLSDSIKDTSHVNLDGDGDGNPGVWALSQLTFC